MEGLDLPEVPRVKTCFFGTSLHIGTQLIAFVSILNCFNALSVLWGVSIFGHLNCVEKSTTCKMFTLYMIIKTIQITVNAFMLFSIYTSKNFKFMSVWVWYTLVESFITFFWRYSFQSIQPDPTWSFIFQLGWNLYSCLVVYSYYKQLSKTGESSGETGI